MSSIAVAISTTGDPHRLNLLSQCVKGWDAALPFGASLFITVDGDDEACHHVENVVSHWTGSIYRVGQPLHPHGLGAALGEYIYDVREGRLGVAVNKNTGIELMMHNTNAEHLFLSDDDIWPLNPDALDLHVSGNGLDHSMVCWGKHRLLDVVARTPELRWASWSWPRGSMLYTRRSVVEKVGGMIEAFGPGGHEHVEWSRRIHQAGLTPVLYPSPFEYANQTAMDASHYWYAEDMPKRREGIAGYARRKRGITSVRRQPDDWVMIDEIMARRDGDTSYVPYTAGENHRGSATLYHNHRA